MKHRLLIVDDDPGVRKSLKTLFEYEELNARLASSGGEALSVYPEFRPHVVVLDVKMAGMDGLDTLARIKELDPGSVVVMMSGHASIATALEATRRGAFDFLEKPLDTDRVLVTVRNAITQAALAGENRRLRTESEARNHMVGDAPALKEVRDVIARVGPTAARVLITGENGTGKELVARAIHDASPRNARPFVEVNCAAIPSELIESELFGHVKGSFTGAVSDRPGKFEQADEGTLFLDEVGDMSLAAQAKVLRVLQEGMVTRVGGTKTVQVDVRVIAATNKHVEEEIRQGRFREDLFYRLNVVPVRLPPLRERREDVKALVQHFIRQLSGGAGTAGKTFEAAAIERLEQRKWPGNVRELRNAIERLLILSTGRTITANDVGRLLGGDIAAQAPMPATVGTLADFLLEAEKSFLTAKLAETNWNISDTAKAIKMPRSALYKRIETYGLKQEMS